MKTNIKETGPACDAIDDLPLEEIKYEAEDERKKEMTMHRSTSEEY